MVLNWLYCIYEFITQRTLQFFRKSHFGSGYTRTNKMAVLKFISSLSYEYNPSMLFTFFKLREILESCIYTSAGNKGRSPVNYQTKNSHNRFHLLISDHWNSEFSSKGYNFHSPIKYLYLSQNSQ